MKRLVLVGMAIAIGIGCTFAPADERTGVDGPDLGQFETAGVGDFLDHRCGSLDCHGSATRNLIMYGCYGLRLDPNGTGLAPGCRASGGQNTQTQEYEATYRSIVGLEPAVMTAVVQGGGAHPELLTLVRKARGWDSHKGGALVTPGDDQDNCITSWLAGNADSTACGNALTNTP
ncbi:MAG TPA: hypothetical protein VGH28_26240 [Polyangiaceae bacterium]|jgi:hypothetical protein